MANSQWTCSAGGSTFLLEIGEQSRQHGEVEEEPDGDHEQRWLDDEPPEALVVRVQDRKPVRLDDRPDHAREGGQRAERCDNPRTGGSLYGNIEFRDELPKTQAGKVLRKALT